MDKSQEKSLFGLVKVKSLIAFAASVLFFLVVSWCISTPTTFVVM